MCNCDSHMWELKARWGASPCSSLRWWLVFFCVSVSLTALSTGQSGWEMLWSCSSGVDALGVERAREHRWTGSFSFQGGQALLQIQRPESAVVISQGAGF